ncbi:MAG: Gfo/Idh/MocA family oxidoreductase [Lachnospiraceae bacterium]|nr:Gfo/Idh/MocA family oxidoreductase [Lachnospiraceae bacterium]
MKLALIGAGQRGMIYAEYAYFKKGVEIVAVVEPHKERREIAAEKLQIAPENVFDNVDDFFQKKIECNAVILASMDKDHYEQAMKALEIGYDLLLEKPISPNIAECMDVWKQAKKYGRKVIVCHVLRYTNFFSEIKKILESKELGKVIAIQHNENVGNFHIAHSFVRGNWRNSETSSPIIMQKSCHDMDILTWLVDSEAKKISSFGSLAHFTQENAPKNSTDRCSTCPIGEACHYNAYRAYLPVRGNWPATLLGSDQSEEGIRKALETSPYGRCVYKCDNNVCDHQVTLIEFKNGVHVSFVLSGFTNNMSRTMKIMCEYGEIRAEDEGNIIEVTKFNANAVEKVERRVIRAELVGGAHGGGDVLLMEDFLSQLENDGTDSKTAIDRSIESHVMAFAAEEARVTGKVLDIDEVKARFL